MTLTVHFLCCTYHSLCGQKAFSTWPPAIRALVCERGSSSWFRKRDAPDLNAIYPKSSTTFKSGFPTRPRDAQNICKGWLTRNTHAHTHCDEAWPDACTCVLQSSVVECVLAEVEWPHSEPLYVGKEECKTSLSIFMLFRWGTREACRGHCKQSLIIRELEWLEMTKRTSD